MASTPSTSSLSAVLRCRGNIWTRNPPTKRPGSAASSLGLSGGALRDSSAERSGSSRGSERKAVPRGERPVAGSGPSVDWRWDTGEEGESRGDVYKKKDKITDPKLWQSAAAPRVQNALVRHVRRATSTLPGEERFSRLVHVIKQETSAAQVTSVQILQLPPGLLRLSITVPVRVENPPEDPPLGSVAWSFLKVSCVSVASLVSRLVFLKLAVSSRSSSRSGPAPRPLLVQQVNDANRVPQQEHGETQASTQDGFSSGPEVTQDRPD